MYQQIISYDGIGCYHSECCDEIIINSSNGSLLTSDKLIDTLSQEKDSPQFGWVEKVSKNSN